MQLFVKSLKGQTFTLDAEPTDTICDIKEKVADKDGTPVEHQRLIWMGRPLENERTLADYKIGEQSTLHLVMRLRGGMMHEASGRDGTGALQAAASLKKVETPQLLNSQ